MPPQRSAKHWENWCTSLLSQKNSEYRTLTQEQKDELRGMESQ